MTTFKKGDRFIPHKPKENKKSPKWTTRMDEYDNKLLTVEHISPYTGVIHTDDCPFIFNPDWCEKVEELPNNHIPDVGKTIDWEQRKWEASIAFTAAIISNPNIIDKNSTLKPEWAVELGLKVANKMIKQLKQQ